MGRLRPKSVVLLGPFGFGNLGDAAIQEAVIQNLRRLKPDIAIWGISLNPEDTKQRHGIESFALHRRYRRWVGSAAGMDVAQLQEPGWLRTIKRAAKRFSLIVALHKRVVTARRRWAVFVEELRHWWDAYRYLKGKDLLIFSGGGQLDEYWGGPWDQPYSVFKWTVLTRLRGTRVVFLSVGIGSIDRALTRHFFKYALLLAHYRSFRDEGSRGLVESRIGVKRRNHVVPDMAYSLDWMPPASVRTEPGTRLAVGIGPMAYFDPRGGVWPEQDAAVYGAYVDKVARFANWLLSQGHRIVFFTGEAVHDRPVIEDVRNGIAACGVRPSRDQLQEEPIKDVRDLLTQLSQTDLVIASRFHGVLLAHLMLKPVLAISYERKVNALMREVGQDKYCVNIETFDTEQLKPLFFQLVGARARLEADLRTKVHTYRRAVENQYLRILDL